MSAQIGANGVSMALIRAVSAAGKRRAPSIRVTQAKANTKPKQSERRMSDRPLESGAPKRRAGVSSKSEERQVGMIAGRRGQIR